MNFLEHENLMQREMLEIVCKDNETHWSDLNSLTKNYLCALHEPMIADPRDVFVDSDNKLILEILEQLTNGDISNLASLPSLLKANKDAYYESYIGNQYDDLVDNLDDYWDGHDDQTDMAEIT
jgi:hypothetical protein